MIGFSNIDMPQNGHTVQLTVDTATSERPERLSRSPHPYHRRGPSFEYRDRSVFSPKGFSSAIGSKTSKHAGGGFSDVDRRKRRKSRKVESDSGTEADDEKGAILLGLPAPPTRPRKGLKDAGESSSPLLTPSYLDDNHVEVAWEKQFRRHATLHDKSADEEAIKIRKKFVRRRRAEFLRRITETSLSLIVCCISARGATLWSLARLLSLICPIKSTVSHYSREGESILFKPYLITVFGLYALYPLRIIKKNHARNEAQNRSRLYIHFPAAFDPAPLLYPVVLPAIVAFSIEQSQGNLLLLNMILGIAAMPSKTIPFGRAQWYNSPQWILSLSPIWAPSLQPARRKTFGREVLFMSSSTETLSLLYALHQTLLAILKHITTTSLLSTELQLLSVILINLLILSESPQTLILQSILWIGGVSVLVLCSRVLRWGVTLARIPSWRFRNPAVSTRRGIAIFDALTHGFKGNVSRMGLGLVSTMGDSSDDGETCDRAKIPQAWNTERLRRYTDDVDPEASPIPLHHVVTIPQSATGDGSTSGFPQCENIDLEHDRSGQRLRRNTLPAYITSSSVTGNRNICRESGIIKPRNTHVWSFRSFTAGQAKVLRWIFALYAYTVVVTVIALPIRRYVSSFALRGYEPIGWAIGYLFGDVSTFRTLMQQWNLDHWVPLPAETDHSGASIMLPGLVEGCHNFLGPANIRLLICAYCVAVVAVGLAIVSKLSAVAEVDTRRKVFHGMMVVMFLPTIFIDPAFVALAFTVALALFLLLDLFRASQLPPIAKPLTYFLAPYVDGRDHRGPVVVSHIFLLIGCAIPLWLSLAATSRTGRPPWEGWEIPTRDLSMVSGVVCVGMGDAAASLIGRRYGRHRWCWSGGKSLEGSLAFATAVVMGLSAARAWLLVGGWIGNSEDSWMVFGGKAAFAGCAASLTEAVLTGGNDNVIVPIILWLLVRGLGI